MKQLRFQVRARRECGKCRGGGVLDHPLWVEFYSVADRENLEEWFAARGFPRGSIPPEELDCDECEGTGWVEFWLDVRGEPVGRDHEQTIAAMFALR